MCVLCVCVMCVVCLCDVCVVCVWSVCVCSADDVCVFVCVARLCVYVVIVNVVFGVSV